MAFRKPLPDRRKLQMVSLIDLIFILLIFFIITSILVRMSDGESRLYLPTPKNEPGEAQILIQIIDDDQYVWLDHTAIDTLYHYTDGGNVHLATADKLSMLLDKMRVNESELNRRIELLKQDKLTTSVSGYFVLVRCPQELPYYYATDILEKVADLPNFEYGCVGGSLAELQNSKDVYIEGNVIEMAFK